MRSLHIVSPPGSLRVADFPLAKDSRGVSDHVRSNGARAALADRARSRVDNGVATPGGRVVAAAWRSGGSGYRLRLRRRRFAGALQLVFVATDACRDWTRMERVRSLRGALPTSSRAISPLLWSPHFASRLADCRARQTRPARYLCAAACSYPSLSFARARAESSQLGAGIEISRGPSIALPPALARRQQHPDRGPLLRRATLQRSDRVTAAS